MTTQILEPPTTAARTWRWCQEAFAQHGVKLAFPKNTNPQKTYQWRYVTKLTNKIDEWGFDTPTAKAFISFAVDYVKEKRLLHKGLSVFFQNNMMDICYKRMHAHSSAVDNKVKNLRATYEFITTRRGQRTAISVLLSRESFDKARNIVRWYQSGDITAAYLAVSAVCTEALARLAVVAPDERNLLPSNSELCSLAIGLSKNDELRSQARAILGPDWRTLC